MDFYQSCKTEIEMIPELRIEFLDIPGEVHYCTSFVDGDSVVFRCPLCPQYERRINFDTGKMQAKGQSQDIRHVGSINGEKEDVSGLIFNQKCNN